MIKESDASLSDLSHTFLFLFKLCFAHILVTINVDGEFFVSGGGLSSRFRIASLNFHWGRCNATSAGSEHSLNGMKYPLEVKEQFDTVWSKQAHNYSTNLNNYDSAFMSLWSSYLV